MNHHSFIDSGNTVKGRENNLKLVNIPLIFNASFRETGERGRRTKTRRRRRDRRIASQRGGVFDVFWLLTTS